MRLTLYSGYATILIESRNLFKNTQSHEEWGYKEGDCP